MNDEQPISVHEGTRSEYESEGGRNNSIPELSVRSLLSDMFTNLTIRNSEIYEVGMGEAPIQNPQHICDDEDFMSDIVVVADWRKRSKLTT